MAESSGAEAIASSCESLFVLRKPKNVILNCTARGLYRILKVGGWGREEEGAWKREDRPGEKIALYIFWPFDKRRKRNREGIGKAQSDFLEERRKENINSILTYLILGCINVAGLLRFWGEVEIVEASIVAQLRYQERSTKVRSR